LSFCVLTRRHDALEGRRFTANKLVALDIDRYGVIESGCPRTLLRADHGSPESNQQGRTRHGEIGTELEKKLNVLPDPYRLLDAEENTSGANVQGFGVDESEMAGESL